IHQYFVPGRSAMFKDVLIDFCGVITGFIIVFTVSEMIRFIRKKRIA
ncbi:MAG: VanZ family protein, partial [Clostridia bacterium]|nr:VanZ family protein [Clostridia bacterium]